MIQPGSGPAGGGLGVTNVMPSGGWPLHFTQVAGAGFEPGVRVRFDGIDAAAHFVSSSVITVSPPLHAPGPVDVEVINPGGKSVLIRKGFTYFAATISASATAVAPGAELTVTWNGPGHASDVLPPDIVRLSRVGDLNNSAVWERAAGSPGAGTQQLAAPMDPGRYHFLYLIEGRHLLTTSAVVTVGVTRAAR